jgi:hypothetical protein
MTTSSLPTFLDSLVAELQARPGLAGVAVFSCPVPQESLGAEGLEFAEEVPVAQTRAAMGSTDTDETYAVRGSCLVTRPVVKKATLVASVNAAAKAARDRCAAIIEEVTDELASNDTMTTGTSPAVASVADVRIAAQTWRQGMGPEPQMARFCWVEFELSVIAHITP